MPHNDDTGTTDSAEDAEDSFGSGGGSFRGGFPTADTGPPADDDPVGVGGSPDGDPAGGGEAPDDGGGGGGVDDDDDDGGGGSFRGGFPTVGTGPPADDSGSETGGAASGIGGQPTQAVSPALRDDPGSAEAAQDAAAGDSIDQIRNDLARVTPVDPGVEDRVGSAEAAQDALGAGVLGSPTTLNEDSAEGAQDLFAIGPSVNPRRGTDELIGGTSAVEETIRDLDEAAGELSEELGEGVAGITNPQIDTSGIGGIAQDIREGRAPRADEPVLDAQPQEAPDNTGRNVAQTAGTAAGEVLFGTLPSVGVTAVEAGEVGAAVGQSAGRDAAQAVRRGDLDADTTAQTLDRAEREFRATVVRPTSRVARRTFDTNPDAISEVAAQGRADEPLVSVEEGRRDEVSGTLIGAAAGSAVAAPATTAASPLQVTRFDVPVESGGSTTVRAVRTRVPGVEDRTLATSVGGSPTPGTGSVDLQRVDLERLGQDQPGESFEPVGQFETDLATSSVRSSLSDQSVSRVNAVESTLDIGDEASDGVSDLRGAVSNVRDLPEDTNPDEVIDALSDVDATIFGSGAVRAQAPDFRDPGDLDIVVSDKDTAKERLSDVLGDELAVERAFDIKEPDDFAGLQEGEAFGFGKESRAPIQTDEGVAVNPVGEELQRKAGASGFIRGETVGPTRVDVGPRGNPGGNLRTKDPEDALAIARAVAGEDDPRVREFERAFFGPESDSGTSNTQLTDQIREFVADERAQAQLGRRAQRSSFDDSVTEPELDVRQEGSRLFGRDNDQDSSPVLDGDQGGASLPVLSAGAGSSGFGSALTAGGLSVGSTGGSSGVASQSPVSSGLGSLTAAAALSSTAVTSTATSSGRGPSGVPSSVPPSSPFASLSPTFGSPGTSTTIETSPPQSGLSSSSTIGPPGGDAPPQSRQPPDREEEDQESEEESLLGLRAQDETFGTGIFTPGEDDPAIF